MHTDCPQSNIPPEDSLGIGGQRAGTRQRVGWREQAHHRSRVGGSPGLPGGQRDHGGGQFRGRGLELVLEDSDPALEPDFLTLPAPARGAHQQELEREPLRLRCAGGVKERDRPHEVRPGLGAAAGVHEAPRELLTKLRLQETPLRADGDRDPVLHAPSEFVRLPFKRVDHRLCTSPALFISDLGRHVT